MIHSRQDNTTLVETDETAPLRVSIQGYKGAFHEIAARHCFSNQEVNIVPAHTFNELVETVEKGETADTGLMAIENTLAGSLMHNYELLRNSSLQITGEVYLRIKQNLMALPGQKIEDLSEVHSHPIAIEQCRPFFRQYPNIRLVAIEDTALAARNIQEKQAKGIGAIASTLAADVYDMEILAASIETNKKNHTRFLVLNQETEIPTGAKKVSLCFSVDHLAGALHQTLGVLAAYNINLTKIQSAPIIGKPWEYRFYVDFVSKGKVSFEHALHAIEPLTHDLQVLGIYHEGAHFDV